eukprot:COSAG04_NODE_21760_length_368_cov_0.743494_1_plen_20_part_01
MVASTDAEPHLVAAVGAAAH